MILAKYKYAAIGIGLIAMLVGAASGGAIVATWKANSGHAKELRALADDKRDLERKVFDLKLAISEANEAVSIMEAETKAAMSAKNVAQAHAADLASFSKSRMDKLERTVNDATATASDVLKHYWELRQ